MQKTCIIIPCYNEESRFPINDFLNYLTTFKALDFCFVNDGSTDKTLSILNQLKNNFSNITVLNLSKNGGKAEAIRYAVLNLENTKYDYLGYLVSPILL